MNAASLEEEEDGVTTGAAGGEGGATSVGVPEGLVASPQLGFDSVVATRDAFGCFARGDVGGWLSQTTLGTKLDVFDEHASLRLLDCKTRTVSCVKLVCDVYLTASRSHGIISS